MTQIPDNQPIPSDAWRAWGAMVSTDEDLQGEAWLAGKGPLPKTPRGFLFWCPACDEEFWSILTPRQCPHGCLADELDDPVRVEHKGYVANTFPFAVSREPVA